MRIVFMGTPDFAVPCLQAMHDDGHELAGVFCQPDKPQGRRMTLTPPPVKIKAEELGLPVFQPAKMRDGEALAILKRLRPELIAVVAFGRILPKDILELPKYGCVNVHGSLLPKYRGAAPIQWSVINGDETGGVTSMYLAEGLDCGDMILRREVTIGPDETAGELFDRLAPLGAQCLSDTVRLIAAGSAPRIPQDETLASAAPMLTRESGRLDFTKSAKTLHDLVRGLNPWPSASAELFDRRIKVHKSEVITGVYTPGERVTGADGLVIGCGEGALRLLTVQPEGKNRMTGADFLRGLRL